MWQDQADKYTEMLGERGRETEVKITSRNPDQQKVSHVKNEITSLPCMLRQQLLSPALAPDTDLGGGLFQKARSPFDDLSLSDRWLILKVITVERLKDTKRLWTLKVHLFCTLIGSERWARAGCLVLPGSTPALIWT